MDKYEVWLYIICIGGKTCTYVCGIVICCLHMIDMKSPDSSLRKPDKTKLIACISLRYVVQLRCMSLVSVKSPEPPIHDDVRSIFLTFQFNFCACLLLCYQCWFNGLVWGQLELEQAHWQEDISKVRPARKKRVWGSFDCKKGPHRLICHSDISSETASFCNRRPKEDCRSCKIMKLTASMRRVNVFSRVNTLKCTWMPCSK